MSKRRSKTNETNTIMITGIQGSGKTTLAVKFVYEEAKQYGRKVIANFKIKGIKSLQISFYDVVDMLSKQELPETYLNASGKKVNFKRSYARIFGKAPTDIDDVFKNSVLCFDEMHVAAHAYAFLSSSSQIIGEFITQIRKRGILFIGTTQFFSQVAKQVRIHINTLIHVKNNGNGIFELDVRGANDAMRQHAGYYDLQLDHLLYDLKFYFDKFDTTQIIHYKPVKIK